MSRCPTSVLSIVCGVVVASMGLGAGRALAAPLKVACTGTSAMMGLGSSPGQHVPDEMGKVLGAGFEVHNYGVQGTTAINSIGSGYAKTAQYKAALALNPDIALFWFGGNDSFAGTWENNKANFKPDYSAMVKAFQALPTKPRTFLVRLWVNPGAPVRRDVLDKEILPIINEIAAETNSTVIDYRTLIEANPQFLGDGMHPNNAGTAVIGKLFAETVTKALNAVGADAGAPAVDAGGPADVSAPPITDATVAEVPATPAGTGGSSGGGGVSGSGGTSGSGGSPAAGSGGSGPKVDGGSSGGCRVAGQSDLGLGAVWMLAGLGVVVFLRRRRASGR